MVDEAAETETSDDEGDGSEKPAKTHRLGIATVARPCLIGAAALTALHAIIGVHS